MDKIYMIALDVLVIENGETVTDTCVCENFGGFIVEKEANAKALLLNEEAEKDAVEGEEQKGEYYVISISVK